MQHYGSFSPLPDGGHNRSVRSANLPQLEGTDTYGALLHTLRVLYAFVCGELIFDVR